ncbi:MgtC/SapB family protein [Methylocystis parvus]|uniref:MgtC/SapB family protein n=1 Tax=Methylocystis parvus TaxID=134 RepID=A0A6B8M4K0_9HYPH|nr:DUF4010 domain-containing protein [Methylocystis parvus]QGM97288.1 MgtC/SapB family protein [Methylocystis parvus]WBJ98800.1 DUF4010 domain-containing protein [Methylocystis parvus OBBP]
MTYPWSEFSVALAVGLMIGLERERSKGEGLARRQAGVRTFALAAIIGAIAMHVGGENLLGVTEGAVAALAAVSYFRDRDTDPGLTTEVGLLATRLLGGLTMSDAPLASGLGAMVAVIFAAKNSVHGFIKATLTEAEVNDGLVFAIATFVVWPQLPNRYLGPYQAINPHNIWLLVILVLAIGACGHVATRLFGAQYGLPVSGLASGFVSSTATIGSMASYAAKDPTGMTAAVSGAAFSTVSTFIQSALLIFAVSQPTFLQVAPMLAAGGIVAAIYGFAFALGRRAPETSSSLEEGRAFSLPAAFALASLMALMLIVAAALRDSLGEAGIIVGSALAGIVDAHSSAISVASLVAAGKLETRDALVPILAALTSNALAKVAMAIGAGSTEFSARIVPGLVLSMAAAWVVAIAAGYVAFGI